MKKHWKIVAVVVAFAILLGIQIRDIIAINNIEDWLAVNYSYQQDLNKNAAQTNDIEKLNRRVSELEYAVIDLEKTTSTMWNYLNR
jgi:hypothetical protein